MNKDIESAKGPTQFRPLPRRLRNMIPGAAAHEAPLEPLGITMQKLASKNCKYCHGRGMLRMGETSKHSMIRPVPCFCAEKGYTKFIEKHQKLPCKICGKTGKCSHRALKLVSLILRMAWADARVDMTMGIRDPQAPSDPWTIPLGGPDGRPKGRKPSGGQDSRGVEPEAPNRFAEGEAER
jgi:hypothetical protein